MNVVKFKQRPALLECSSCEAEGSGSCECGVPYVAAGTRAAQTAAEHPGMSNRAIAAQLGISEGTVRTAKKSGAQDYAPDRVIGKDGKSYPAKRKKPNPRIISDDEMPSEEEAEQSEQDALYDQVCLFLDLMTDATRQKLFARIKRKYKNED